MKMNEQMTGCLFPQRECFLAVTSSTLRDSNLTSLQKNCLGLHWCPASKNLLMSFWRHNSGCRDVWSLTQAIPSLSLACSSRMWLKGHFFWAARGVFCTAACLATSVSNRWRVCVRVSLDVSLVQTCSACEGSLQISWAQTVPLKAKRYIQTLLTDIHLAWLAAWRKKLQFIICQTCENAAFGQALWAVRDKSNLPPLEAKRERNMCGGDISGILGGLNLMQISYF